jgi:hypothetical protein
MNIDNKFFENVAELKYFVKTLAVQNCIHAEIKSNLNSGIVCYLNWESFSFLYLETKIELYRVITNDIYTFKHL